MIFLFYVSARLKRDRIRESSMALDYRTSSAQGFGAQACGYCRMLIEPAFAFVAILWLGLLVGVSFLATPVKFQAPSLDLPTALDVGRVTFALLAKAEQMLGVVLVAVALLSFQFRAWCWIGIAALAVILIAQAAWLLPVLDERVGRIIAGEQVPATSHHLFYVVSEAVKALLLLGLSIGGLWRLAAAQEKPRCA